MNSASKKILFVIANYHLAKAQEALDAILMASTFNQEVSVIFLADGVFLLNKNQNLEKIHVKNFIATYKALSLYDVQNVYLDAEALAQRHLNSEDLLIPVRLLNPKEIAEIIHSQDVIMSF